MVFSHNNSIYNIDNILEIQRIGTGFKGTTETVALHFVGGTVKTLTFHDNDEVEEFCRELYVTLKNFSDLIPLSSSTFINEEDDDDDETIEMEILSK